MEVTSTDVFVGAWERKRSGIVRDSYARVKVRAKVWMVFIPEECWDL